MDRRLRPGLLGAAGFGAVLAVLPFVLPAETYKGEIEGSVARATGRSFTIAGPLHFTLFPEPGLRAERVALANAPGGRAPAFLTARSLGIALRPWPLLAGRIEISTVVLDHPQIALEIGADGRPNWTFLRRPSAPSRGKPHASLSVHLSGLRIEHGHVTYANARTGAAHSIDDVNAAIAASDLDGPVAAAGSFAYRGLRARFDARAAALRPLLDNRAATLDMSLTSDAMHVAFQGTVGPGGRADGRIGIDSASLQGAGAWLGMRLPPVRLSLASDVKDGDHVTELPNLNATLDGARIGGALRLDKRAKVPSVAGTLTIDRLDLDPYIEAPRRPGPPNPRPPAEGWSKAPVALDLLRRVDARLTVEAGAVRVKGLKLGRTHIDATLRGGRLHAALGPMALYGGSGAAQLEIDAGTAAFRNTVALDHVALAPLLADTLGVAQIEGTGAVRLEAASRGATPDAIMRGLSGQGRVAFRDGRLRGVDLGAVARAIGRMLGGAAGPDAFTQYSALDGSFRIAGGVLTSVDFALAGPLIRTTGGGQVDLGNRAIDFRIEPKASASIAGLKMSLGLPFRIQGPWSHVHYAPDLAGLVDGLLKSLDAPPKKKHKSMGDALKNMLGIH